MNKKYMEKDESAVSPVIGSILMVAVAVMLSSIIGSVVFGMGSDIDTLNLVAVSAQQTNSTTIEFTVMGGLDTDDVRYLNATIDGVRTDPPADYEPEVGSVWTAYSESSHSNGGFNSPSHVIVSATFSSGGSQVVLDMYI